MERMACGNRGGILANPSMGVANIYTIYTNGSRTFGPQSNGHHRRPLDEAAQKDGFGETPLSPTLRPDRGDDARLTETKNKKKKASNNHPEVGERAIMPSNTGVHPERKACLDQWAR